MSKGLLLRCIADKRQTILGKHIKGEAFLVTAIYHEMDMEMPFFMSNPEWYVAHDVVANGFPEDDRGYHLTDEAPQEAIDSYNAFYAMVEGMASVMQIGKEFGGTHEDDAGIP